MRHATVNAVATIRAGHYPAHGHGRFDIACDGRSAFDVDGAALFIANDAFSLLCGNAVDMPTCSTCLILLDAAMERLPDPMKEVT